MSRGPILRLGLPRWPRSLPSEVLGAAPIGAFCGCFGAVRLLATRDLCGRFPLPMRDIRTLCARRAYGSVHLILSAVHVAGHCSIIMLHLLSEYSGVSKFSGTGDPVYWVTGSPPRYCMPFKEGSITPSNMYIQQFIITSVDTRIMINPLLARGKDVI